MSDDIAIIGMACRVPGAENPGQLWANLLAGRDAATPISPAAAVRAGARPDQVRRPDYVLTRHDIDPSYRDFDAALFGLTRREADLLDPQHRVFAEVVWEALENAGCAGDPDDGRIGVFASAGMNLYVPLLLRALGHETPADDPSIWLLNDPDFLATRLSYLLDLRGPSVSAQTACSGSLVAIHLACRSLLAGECETAVVGGSALDLLAGRGYLYQPGGIGSADGRCRPFDAATTGSARGNGAAAVVLRPLAEAERLRDGVLAVIRGSAINNDGRRKAGFTAPSVDGQVDVIRAALDRAGLAPGDISYVEAHGTGTALGDPIELRALERVFGAGPRDRPCEIGSVKANVGHLDAAAGVLGLIKAVLVAGAGQAPPQANFEQPAEALAAAPALSVSRTAVPLGNPGQPNVGVSSLGFGGTNAHVVLSGYPRRVSGPESPGPVLLPLSAATPWSLREQCRRLAEYLDGPGREVPLAAVGYGLQCGRRPLSYRRWVVGRTHGECAAALRAAAEETGAPAPVSAPVAAPVPVRSGPAAEPPAAAVEELLAALPVLGPDRDAWLRAATPAGADAGRPGTEPARQAMALRYAHARLLIALGLDLDPVDEVSRLLVEAAAGRLEPGAANRLVEAAAGATIGGAASANGVAAGGAVRLDPVPAGPEGYGAEALLCLLGRLWADGRDLRWRALHPARWPQPALPNYPFDRRRHWPLPDATGEPAGARLHVQRWAPAPVPPPGPATTGVPADGAPAARQLVVLATPGYDHAPVLAALAGRFASARHHDPGRGWPAGLADRPVVLDLTALDPGVEPMARYRALCRLLDALPAGTRPTVVHVTSGLARVHEQDRVVPERALPLGPLLALPRELVDATGTVLDLPAAELADPATLAQRCLAVTDPATGLSGAPLVAWRGGQPWLPAYRPEPAPAAQVPPGRLRWLLTGGLGGVATALAGEILAGRPDDVVVLASRTAPPGDLTIGAHRAARLDADPPPPAGPGSAPALPDGGGRLWTVRADVRTGAELVAVRRLCDTAFGGVDVVLHTAGRGDGQLISGWRSELADRVLDPKVAGAARVCETFAGRAHVVLFSSLTTAKPVAGAADYIAANAHLNALAEASRAAGPTPAGAPDGTRVPDGPGVLAVAWPAWRGLGMAEAVSDGITPAEGLGIILGQLGRSGTLLVDIPGDPLPPGPVPPHQPPAGAGPSPEPGPEPRAEAVAGAAAGTGTEPPRTPEAVRAAVVELWQEVLGYRLEDESVDVFDAGADSFMVLRFLDLVERRFDITLALDELFDSPTVAAQTELVVERVLAHAEAGGS